MEKALRACTEILRLVRHLPKDTRPYYTKNACKNFVNYKDVDASDSISLIDLFKCTYNHSVWVLDKYSMEKSVADKLKKICYG